MTKKWDSEEELDDAVMDMIDGDWDILEDKEKTLIATHVVLRYARINEIDHQRSVQHLCKYVIPVDGKTKKEQSDVETKTDFWWFALGKYGLDIKLQKNGQFIVHKMTDKELEIVANLDQLSVEEFRKQMQQARYPTVNDKKAFVEDKIIQNLEYMDSPEAQNIPVRPEIVARIRKPLEGYDDAPPLYIMARSFVYEAALGRGWDEAEIEKVLEEHVKDMVKDGQISGKEYNKIKKIVKREDSKKIKARLD